VRIDWTPGGGWGSLGRRSVEKANQWDIRRRGYGTEGVREGIGGRGDHIEDETTAKVTVDPINGQTSRKKPVIHHKQRGKKGTSKTEPLRLTEVEDA